jgi:hypothetical protein
MALKHAFSGKRLVSLLARRGSVAVLAAAALAAATAPASADEYVSGYYRGNGTYVPGYYRTDRDGRTGNNYSHYGNYNPYTGRYGTHRDGGSSTWRSNSHRTPSSRSYSNSRSYSSGRRRR